MPEQSSEQAKKRQNRRHRHVRRPTPSEASSPAQDYNTLFPALCQTSRALPTCESMKTLTYSDIAARQFDLAPMTSSEAKSPNSAQFVPTIMSTVSERRSRVLQSALRTWMPSTSTSNHTITKPNLSAPSSYVRTTFDKLFSRKIEPIVQFASKPDTNCEASVAVLRSSVAKTHDSQLLLPDYLLIRLIKSNPAISNLVHNQLASVQAHKAPKNLNRRSRALYLN